MSFKPFIPKYTSTHLPSDVEPLIAVGAFRSERDVLTRDLLQLDLPNIATKLYSKSIISAAALSKALNQTHTAFNRTVSLLSVVEDKIRVEPHVFTEFVKILESEPALRVQGQQLVINYLGHGTIPPLTVFPYLKKLDTAKLYELGVELGLNIIKLKRISSIELPLELCERWLREDDAVYQTSGVPTWISLVRALRSIGANSLADMIEQERPWIVRGAGSLQDDESEDFIADIAEATMNDDKISRKLAHGMFVGPTGSGKSSLMDRLLGRKRKGFSPSTGVAEPVVVVDVDSNPSTFHPVTVLESDEGEVGSDEWNAVECDESLVRQMGKGSIKSTSQPSTVSAGTPTASLPGEIDQHDAETPTLTQQYRSLLRERSMIRKSVEKCGGYKKLRRFLKKSFSLYLRDTGGQVEFQEMIPLLIFGPSIFFFVFRLDLDFKKKFEVKYRKSPGESLNCYTSSITTEEAFLQFLASVDAMNTPNEIGVKTHKPLVFVVGTHKDKLTESPQEKIDKLNEDLNELITKNGFQKIIQYADKDKGQVMFTVNNGSDNEEDFKLIRSTVNNFIRGREEFSIDYPIRYLLFCLELQNLNRKVLSFDECKVMAANYGIEEGQLSHLLQFLHLRIGVIRYFDKDGVRHIVICKPEVLFNKVTDLIVKTFSSGAPLRDTERDDFKEKGIITASVLNTVIRKGDIPPEVFLQLLVHLRIAAKFSKSGKQDGEDKFFLPCVLNHVHVSECTKSQPMTVMPLAVKFQCKHCPKGLFGVLITHLMTPDLSEGATSNTTTFTLMQDKIFKDQVSFKVVSDGAQDEMTLKSYPSHLEIKFVPEVVDPEYRDTTVAEVCNSVRQIVETSISRSLHDLHYNESRVKATLCFSCDHENCSDLHPIEKRKKGFTIFCDDKRQCIPAKGKYWYGVEPETVCESNDRPSTRKRIPSETARRCSDELPPKRKKQESPPLCEREVIPHLKKLDTAKLYELGVELGLNITELKRIPTEQLPLEMCERWLREDHNVHQTSGTPTWSSLATAMRNIGASGVASSIDRDILEIH